MRVTDESLNKFIQIHKEEFGEELSTAEARELASSMLELYLILLSRTLSEQKSMDKEDQKSA